jgi:pimeloyl-ACP methyl ester carboxylesterase
MFDRFLALAGRDRSVYAPDLPGFGDSDPPASRPAIPDYAAAVGDFLESMRFRQIDVLGLHAGALVAAELAITRPKQIRRVIAVSVPVLSEIEREALRRAYSPVPITPDGSQLPAEWRRTIDIYGANVPPEVLARAFTDKLRNGTHSSWVVNAAIQYPVRERLGLIPQQVLVLRPRDELWEATLRARELLPKARFVDLPEQGPGLFETAPEVAADALKDFVRG